MPLSPVLAQWLVGQGHDAVHAAAINLATAPDTVIMAHAKGHTRIVITADLDYPRLLVLSGADSPAVILFRGGDWKESELTNRLSTVISLIPENELTKSLVVIEKTRIRRRTLPL